MPAALPIGGDGRGNFNGNTVEGSSFPNWTGDVRTTRELRMEVQGDRLIERVQRPGKPGTRASRVTRRTTGDRPAIPRGASQRVTVWLPIAQKLCACRFVGSACNCVEHCA